MNAPRSLAHFDHIADTPDAAPRLRRFILDLAVRGKLTPQDPNDEPATDLIRRMAEGKSRLVKAGGIRRPRTLGSVDGLLLRHDIPSSWSWVRLDAIGAIIGGGTPPAGDADNFAAPGLGIAWLTPADLGRQKTTFISRGARDLSEKGYRTSSATIVPEGTVLFTSRAPVGYVAIAANPVATNQGFKSIVPYVSECSRFIAVVMRNCAPEIDAEAPGTTFREVSGKRLASVAIPLPPMAEQQRIVAEVDEMMALCDRLEASISDQEAARDRFSAATLARLSDPDPGLFQLDATFAIKNLTELTTRSDQVNSIRETIRNLAVHGKLVPQDPCDEPVHMVLSNRGIVADTNPFPIPESWAWVCSGSVADCRLGKMLDGTKNEGVPRKYLRNLNVRWFDFDLSDLLEMRFEDSELTKFALRRGDVLICEGGEPGRSAVWDGRQTDIYFQKAIHRVRLHDFVDPAFFVMAIRASADDGRLQEYFTGTGIQHLTGRGLGAYSFPLPPLAEQRRIVAKVDEMMDLCRRLEASLLTAQESRRRLLDALLREALKSAKRAEAALPARGHKSE